MSFMGSAAKIFSILLLPPSRYNIWADVGLHTYWCGLIFNQQSVLLSFRPFSGLPATYMSGCSRILVRVCKPPPPFLSSAQQEAQRAQFYVEKAKQDQRQKIIQAEGEAQAAKMVTFSENTFIKFPYLLYEYFVGLVNLLCT